MLTKIRFLNFKSWERLEMSCAPITAIFGTNSSGKSSILQFLLLLKQTKDATDRAVELEPNGGLVQLGTMGDLIFRHEESRKLAWDLSWEEPADLVLKDLSDPQSAPIAQGNKLTIGAEVSISDSGARTTRLSYKLSRAEFSLDQKSVGSNSYELKTNHNASDVPSAFRFIRTAGRPWPVPGPVKSYAFPDQVRTYYQNAGFLAELEARYERLIDGMYYLGPLREYPKRDYLWARSRPSDMGLRGENTINAILAATAAKETRNLRRRSPRMSFQAMVAYWLREMGLIDAFKVEEIAEGSNRWQARVTTRPGASEVFLTDVGFGVSQVLPVITLLQYVPEGSIVILEQPEIHLHPLAQAELAEVIIQAARHRKVQVIVESHSEHLLLRLQRRIAEGFLGKDEIGLYFCDSPEGSSVLTELHVDLLGRIQNWPTKFMGDAFGETAKAEKARILNQLRKN